MRNLGIIICLVSIVLAVSCKTSSVSTKKTAAEHEEDLSYLRPDLSKIDEASAESFSEKEVTVNYAKDLKSELDSVNQVIIERNQGSHYVNGYTIQIYSGNDRQAAYAARDKAARTHPDLQPEITYHQPSYKVKAGEYTDRLEAHQVYESLKEDFPLALLIPERIQVVYE